MFWRNTHSVEVANKTIMCVLGVCSVSAQALSAVSLTVLHSASQWPTGPWIRPTSWETQWWPGPTKCHRRPWRGSRTSLRRPAQSTRSVTPTSRGLHRECINTWVTQTAGSTSATRLSSFPILNTSERRSI